MSISLVSRVYYARDMLLALVGLACGGLFATLKPQPVDLTGKVAVVTGANSGIGLQIALDLTRQGSTVYLACRNMSKAEGAVSSILSEIPTAKGRVKALLLDTSSLASVRGFAKNWESLNTKIDLLFHNAGIGSVPPGQDFSPDGFPILYATNFLGSFLLTYLLEPFLSADARIILTSSTGQYAGAFSTNFSLSSIKETLEPGFHTPVGTGAGKPVPDGAVYSQTKVMQVAFAKLLQNHFDRKAAEARARSRKVAHAFSPGFTLTPIYDKITEIHFSADPIWWLLKKTNTVLAVDAIQGAATGVWLASTNEEAVVGQGMGGGYWYRMTRRLSNVDMMTKETVERFWVRWEADAGVQWR